MPVVKLVSVVFIETVRGVPLVTVLFMASVMLPLFLPAGVLPETSWWTQAAGSPSIDANNPASEPVLALQRELQDEALEVDVGPG